METCRTWIPQNAILSVGRPRPYYIIIILKYAFHTYHRIKSKFPNHSNPDILERHLLVNHSTKAWLLAGRWVCKLTDVIPAGNAKQLTPRMCIDRTAFLKHCTLCQCCFNVGRASVADVGITLKQHWVI